MKRRDILLGTAGAAIITSTAFAAPPRRVPDIGILALEWSTDYGATWGNDVVPGGSDVLFRILAHNRGLAATPPHVPIEVEFTVDGWPGSRGRRASGLGVGLSAEIRAAVPSDGLPGDEFWPAPLDAGTHVVRAVARRIATEPEEEDDNGTTAILAVTAADDTSEVQDFGVFGSVIGGAVGTFFGGPIGNVAGAIIGEYVGSQFTTTNIGASTPIAAYQGNGGGVFPSTFGNTSLRFGMSSSTMTTVFKRHGSIPTRKGSWGNPGSGVKVFGSNGLLDRLRGKHTPARAYLDAFRSSMNTNDRRSLGLFNDNFSDKNGAPTSDGGTVRNSFDGCTDQLYADLGAAYIQNSSYQAALKPICQRCGFKDYALWGKTLRHRSSRNVAVNLRPSPTNGSTRGSSANFGGNGLKATAYACVQLVSLIPGTTHNDWADTAARAAIQVQAQIPPLITIVWRVMMEFLARGYKLGDISRAAYNWLVERGYTINESTVRSIADGILDGLWQNNATLEGGCRAMIARMRSAGISVENPVLDQAHIDPDSTFVELIVIYSDWKDGLDVSNVYVRADGRIGRTVG